METKEPFLLASSGKLLDHRCPSREFPCREVNRLLQHVFSAMMNCLIIDQWGLLSWTETSKTVGPNQPALFICWMSWVLDTQKLTEELLLEGEAVVECVPQ